MTQEYTFPGLVVDYEYIFINTGVVIISETFVMSQLLCTNHDDLWCQCNPVFIRQMHIIDIIVHKLIPHHPC